MIQVGAIKLSYCLHQTQHQYVVIINFTHLQLWFPSGLADVLPVAIVRSAAMYNEHAYSFITFCISQQSIMMLVHTQQGKSSCNTVPSLDLVRYVHMLLRRTTNFGQVVITYKKYS